jgi:hypothetical protein
MSNVRRREVNTTLVEQVATRMRVALEAVPLSELPISMSSFPAGSCGDVCLLLGAYLADNGLREFEYVSGDRGSKADNTWTSHAWLASGDLIVDITADQFPDGPSKVIVVHGSEWHQQFEVDRVSPFDFRVWQGPGTYHLHSMYARLRAALFNEQPT